MIEVNIRLLDENELKHLTGIFMWAGIEGRKRIKELEDETDSLHKMIDNGRALVKRWEEENKSLHDELDRLKVPKVIYKELDEAKQVMRNEGYVFYKYKKPTAEVFKQRRRRRTRKEMEAAAARANESIKK